MTFYIYKFNQMKKAYMEDGMLIVREFPTPVYAHAFELSREFGEKCDELMNGAITEEEWVKFWESRKNIDVT